MMDKLELSSYGGLNYAGAGSITNRDMDAGLAYGVISQHLISGASLNNMELDYYGPPTCPNCGEAMVDSADDSIAADTTWNTGEYACVECKEGYDSDDVVGDEVTGLHYEGEGYQITGCLDTDLMVLNSPYCTWAQYCSPCVPGAGNLSTPTGVGIGVLCYALGPDWFEYEDEVPYPLWRVDEDGHEQVLMPWQRSWLKRWAKWLKLVPRTREYWYPWYLLRWRWTYRLFYLLNRMVEHWYWNAEDK